jgi:septal ring factor EnvC (AmiA/AmiB activator)
MEVPMIETSVVEIIKLAFIIGGPLATITWHLYRKMEMKMEKLEGKLEAHAHRMSELEKALLEMRTEFKFTSRDIKEIREMLEKMSNK